MTDAPFWAMNPDDPRHGTNAGAVAHWRAGQDLCEPCHVASRRASKAARLDAARGTPRTVTLGPVAHGVIDVIPRDQLARASGLTVHKLCRLHKAGPSARVHRRTRDRILAAAGRDYWTPTGIQRRLRALHAIGWSMRALAVEVDMWETVLRLLLNREQPHFVRRDVAGKVLDAYDRLCMTPQHGRGASRARNRAAAAGWAPPLAWDDIDTDEAPSGVGYLSPERGDAVRDLLDMGAGLSEALRRLDLKPDALENWCRRNGMADEWRELVRRDRGEVAA